MRQPRVRAFPRARLARLDREVLDWHRRSACRRSMPAFSRTVAELGQRLGLEPCAVELARIQTVRLEELRCAFPGHWRFAVLAEPLADRCGFAALDPQLLAMLRSRIASSAAERFPLPQPGDDGLVAGVFAAGLELLAPAEAGASWRYCGLLGSPGELGRTLLHEAGVLVSWLRLRVGEAIGCAAWVEPGSSLGRSAGRPGGAPALDLREVADLPLAAVRLLGRCELFAPEVAALRPGDLVWLTAAEPPAGRRLRLGGLEIELERTQPGWRIGRLVRRSRAEGGAMNGWEMAAGEEIEALGIEDLPVSLVAEAGRLELTVQQVGGLRVGDVLTLSEEVLGPVELRAGGRLVARGELVEVEGRRGIRLHEVSGRRGRETDAAA